MSSNTQFWRDVALGYSQVATKHERRCYVSSDAEGVVADIFWDETTLSVIISIMAKTSKGRMVVTDATDRS